MTRGIGMLDVFKELEDGVFRLCWDHEVQDIKRLLVKLILDNPKGHQHSVERPPTKD